MKDDFSALVGRMTKAELESCAEQLLSALAGGEKAGDPSRLFKEKGGAADEGHAMAFQEAGQLTPAPQRAAAPLPAAEPAMRNDGFEGAEEELSTKRLQKLDEGVYTFARQPELSEENYAGSRPHLRYENAVGVRAQDMSSVSRFFSRDSRRYDSGFERY